MVMRERASAASLTRLCTCQKSKLNWERKLSFRVFVRVGLESVDQWFVVGVNHDLASLSVVAKAVDA